MAAPEIESSAKSGPASARRLMAVVMVVILLVPLLYGALYLWSFWDPYSRIDRVPVALVNLDTAARTDSGETLTVGDDLADSLLEKGTFAWDVVSEKEAAAGMEDGTYYLSLTIPRDFSANLATADTTAPAPARLTARYAVAHNFIAKQIGERVFMEVRNAAAASASAKYIDSMLLGMSDLKGALGDASLGAGTLADGLATAADGAAALSDGVGTAKAGASVLNAGTASLDSGLAELESGTNAAKSGSFALAASLAKLSVGSDKLAASSSQLAAGTKALETGAATLYGAVGSAASQIEASAIGASKLQAAASGNRQLVDALAAAYAAGQPVDDILAKLQATSTALDSGATQLSSGLSDAAALSPQLSEGARLVSESAAKVDAGATALDGGISQVAQGLSAATSGAARLDVGVGRLDEGVASASSGASRLSAGSGELLVGLGKLDEGAGDLASGLTPAVEGAQTLSAKLADGSDQIVALNDSERVANSEMMSQPVDLDSITVGRADNYGTGLSPYLMPLALWVGALIGYLFLDPFPRVNPKSRKSRGALARTLRGFLPMALLAIGQSVCLGAVVVYGLGLHVAMDGWFWVALAAAALTFVAVLQLFNASLGPVGKLVALALLMLQLTSSGGLFPVETLSPFFEAIHPYLPMTYISAALRGAISGSSLSVVTSNILSTIAFGAGAFVLTMLAGKSRIASACRALGERVGL